MFPKLSPALNLVNKSMQVDTDMSAGRKRILEMNEKDGGYGIKWARQGIESG